MLFLLPLLPLLQEAPAALPVPIIDQLPVGLLTLIGVASSFITELVQKQKSKGASLLIAMGVSIAGGLAAAVWEGVPTADFPVFIVTVFALASTTYAVIFNAGGLSKKLGTSS